MPPPKVAATLADYSPYKSKRSVRIDVEISESIKLQRNLCLCSGTWNIVDDLDLGKPARTPVARRVPIVVHIGRMRVPMSAQIRASSASQ